MGIEPTRPMKVINDISLPKTSGFLLAWKAFANRLNTNGAKV